MTPPPPKFHHYVPKFLLRRFGTGKKDYVHVFDKYKGSAFARAAGKIAGENELYDFNFMGVPMTMESALADVEAKAGAHIARIVKERRLQQSDSAERAELSAFFSIQMVRTPAVTATFRDGFARMQAWLREQGMPEEFFAPDPKVGDGENAERATVAARISKAPKEIGPLLIEKDWVLLETDTTVPYLIGDNPLAMHNTISDGLRGNLGLKVKGIELYIPLSPTLMLGMLCPSHRNTLVDGIERIDRLQNLGRLQLLQLRRDTIRIVDAIDSGSPLKSNPDNVLFFNSLQVLNAERFVFSSNGDFDLVKSMIEENDNVRTGHRMVEATGKF